MSLANIILNLTHVILSEVEGSKGLGNGDCLQTDGRFFAALRGCECFEVPLLLNGVLVVESALWNFHRVEYLFR